MSKFDQISDYWRHLNFFKLHEFEDGNLIIFLWKAHSTISITIWIRTA